MWEAREDGLAVGKVAMQKQFEKLFQSKFGTSGQDMVERVRKLSDFADLDKAFDALIEAQSPDDFRQRMNNLFAKTN